MCKRFLALAILLTACSTPSPPAESTNSSTLQIDPGQSVSVVVECSPAPECPTCPVYAFACGDSVCSDREDCSTCPEDCGECCGDSLCRGDETCSSCESDCGFCPPPPVVSVPVQGSTEDFMNPERGFYKGINLLTGSQSSANSLRAGGTTTAIALVKLDAFRAVPLDQATLDGLTAGFGRARTAGLKIILRFMYNSDGGADAPLSVILGHINQLKPILQANADVIAVMQAGFIGGWGEWHSSTNGNDTPAARKAVVDALLAALPPSRMVQLRTPMFIDTMFPGGPLPASQAFSGTPQSRVGHHNDCFLASNSDSGTYTTPVDTWKAFVASLGLFTPIGGETCKVFQPRSDCASAVAEMRTNHWSYLNSQYHQTVLANWVTQGCATDVSKNLGYRVELNEVKHSQAVRPGGVLELQFSVTNTGYAAPFNKRPAYLVLSQGATKMVVQAIPDVRVWASGTRTNYSLKLRVPANTVPGTYQLSLWMPDDYSSLKNDPRYALRLANSNSWDATTGYNLLSAVVPVDASAPGPHDDTATQLVLLP